MTTESWCAVPKPDNTGLYDAVSSMSVLSVRAPHPSSPLLM